MTERVLTRKVTAVFRKQGARVYQAVGTHWGDSGWPDRWVGWRGFSVWIEFKVNKNRCSPLQKLTIKEIKEAGIAAFVVRLFSQTADIEDENGTTLVEAVKWCDLLSNLRLLEI